MNINKIDNLNRTDFNITHAQKSETEQNNVQNNDCENLITDKSAEEGKSYDDNIALCKRYFVETVKENEALKFIKSDIIDEIFDKFFQNHVDDDNYVNRMNEQAIINDIYELYKLDVYTISIIISCFKKAKRKCDEENPEDSTDEEEKLLKDSINRNTINLNTMFNSKENDMKKLIKSDYGDAEYLTSSRKAIKSAYVIYYNDFSTAWGRVQEGKLPDDFVDANGVGLVINPNVGAMQFDTPEDAEQWLKEHADEWNPDWGEILEVDENGELYDLEGDCLTSSRKPVKSSVSGDINEEDVVRDLYPTLDTYTVDKIVEWVFGLDEDFESEQDLSDYIKTHINDFVSEETDNDVIEDLRNGGYIDSSRKPVKSGRYIKSGTSNFGSNDDVFGYSFPLVTYIAENYMYDEETDSETEERDYEADDWEYRDALDEAKDLADEMNIPQYDDYSEPYLCYEPFMIKFRDGYYEGLWIEVKEGTDETPYDENGEYQGDFDWKPFTEEQMNKYADKLNEYFNKLCLDYGWQKLGVSARFDNGEVWYNKIDNSRKAIKSAYGKRPR